jgi:hypothetical protein
MPKMSFAQQVDGWKALTANALEVTEELPGLREVRAELVQALEAAEKSRDTHRRLRSKAMVEAKRLQQAIVRGEEAEQRLRRFLQASYGPTNPQLRRFGLKPRKGRRPEPRTIDPNSPAETAETAGGE